MKSKTRFLNSLYKRSVDIFNNKIKYTYWAKNFKRIFSYDVNSNNVNIKEFNEKNNKILSFDTPGKNSNINYSELYPGSNNVDFCDTNGNALIKTLNSDNQIYGTVFTYDEEGSMYIGGYTLNTNGITNSDIYHNNELVLKSKDVDRSMFLCKFDKDGNFKWIKDFYVSSSVPNVDINNRITSICSDKNGSIYATGYFTGSIGEGNNILSINDERETFIFRINYDGDIITAIKTDTPSGAINTGTGITFGDNYVYCSGLAIGNGFDIQGQSIMPDTPAALNSYILKLTPNLDVKGVKVINSDTKSVLVNQNLKYENGNIYAFGETNGETNFGTTTSPAIVNTIADNPFIAKYDTDFNLVWYYNAIASGDSRVVSCDVDSNDNVYVSMWFVTDIVINGVTIIANNVTSGVIVKLDNTGNYVWDYNLPDIQNFYDVIFNNNNLYITGRASNNNIDLGDGTLMDNPSSGVYGFIIKLDKDTGLFDGNFFTIPKLQSDIRICSDPFNNMYINNQYYNATLVDYDFTGDTQEFVSMGADINDYDVMLYKICNKYINP